MATKPYTTANFDRSNSVNIDIGKAIDFALKSGTLEFSKELKKFVRDAKKNNKVMDKKIVESNKRIVSKSKQAMASQYVSMRKGGGLKNYRSAGKSKADKRFSGGVMLRTIKSDLIVSTKGKKIRLFDFAGLKREAPQWYRLNFGSGKKPRSSAAITGEIRMNIAGSKVYVGRGITFAGWKAGEANWLPPGFFSGINYPTSAAAHRGLDVTAGKMRKGSGFYLGKPKRKNLSKVRYNSIDRFPTKPTRAYNYLEVGVKVVNQEFAKETAQILRDMKKSFESKGVKRIRAK